MFSANVNTNVTFFRKRSHRLTFMHFFIILKKTIKKLSQSKFMI